jgi:hypothetical protein
LDTAFGRADGSLDFATPLLSVGPAVPLYVSLALGDFLVKLLLLVVLLAPYRAIRGALETRATA